MNIDYDTKQVTLPSLKNKIPFTIIADDDPNSLINSLKHIKTDDHFSTLTENILNSVHDSLSLENEKSIALNDISLNEQQQTQMNSLIQNYNHIFQNRPGLHKFFTYKFNVKPQPI